MKDSVAGTLATNDDKNHTGENTQSGHYNLVLFENDKTILLDDANISYIDNYPQDMYTISYIFIYTAD